MDLQAKRILLASILETQECLQEQFEIGDFDSISVIWKLQREIITPSHIVEELQRLTREMDRGANALYDAECKLADAESAYDRAVSLAFLNNSGTVADRQAVAKLQAVEEKLKADLARAEYNRVKTKMRALSDQATMMAVISKNVELQWRNA